MATDETPRTDPGGQPSDQEHIEVTLSDIEEEVLAVPETGTSAAGAAAVEELTDEELLRGVWQGSTVTEEHILRLRRRRQIPDGVETRVPPAGEIQPEPREGEYIVFYSHFDQGFGLPVSKFTRFMMEQFLLQPHHLPANATLIMSCVAACMEAYVGVRATKFIWAKYFRFARQHLLKVTPKVTVECGAAVVMPRKNSIFPRFAGLKSCKKWQQTYFYIKNKAPKEGEEAADLINLPFPYRSGPPPEKNNFWDYNPDTDERDEDQLAELAAVDKALKELVDEGLTGDDLLCVWIEKRISPLQKRRCNIWQMSGPMDCNRMSTFVLTKDSVFRRVKAIATMVTLEAGWRYGKEPYTRDDPPPSVSTRKIVVLTEPHLLSEVSDICPRICSATFRAELYKM